MELRELCDKTVEIVKKTGTYIKQKHTEKDERKIESKGEHDFVTEVDKASEERLVKELSVLLPEAGFIAEEGSATSNGETYNWIIDPIDGTTNFIHGAYPFAISVALAKDNIPIIGVIYEIGLDECFYAWKGGGAWLDGSPISVSKAASMNNSLIATGFPYTNYTMIENFMKSLDWMMKNSHGVRRLGSAATDIAWVACGRYDGFYEYGLKPWDIAAGIILVQEAGGLVADFKGENDYLFGSTIICSNGLNHKEFVSVINEIMFS